ncbi:hypothetical protein FS837_003276 [Tulasnella sp. UAMH 9824]|nr:hypothetical protein FS837_003276 [Tulasnella sp. UAMH 9824]
MDRYSSQPQQQQPQQQSRRPKNDSFRPALRFPTDPHKPGTLPQKIQHIVAPAPAAILLQSRRKPWEVDSTRLEDLIASTAHTRKVIVVLGDAPSSALEPIVTSTYLSGSLVIVIAASDSEFSISPQQCVPAVRILRLRPKPAANLSPQPQSQMQQRAGSGSEALAESQQHLNASRLNAVLDWAERVGSAWRANPVGQTMFATLQEGEGPADGIGGGKGWKWKSKTRLNGPTYTQAYDVSDGDGSLVPWAARFALNSRSNSSSLASGASSNTSSIFIVDTPNSETARPSFSSSMGGGGKYVRNAMSTSNLASGSDRDRSFDHALAVTRRTGTSHAGHRSVPPPSKSLTPPAPQKRRFSLISFARGKMSPEVSSALSKKAPRPSFDAIINFLPPSSATGADGALGRGAIATNHALAAHNKLLLKQTILVTTAVQRFLVPVTPRGSVRSPGEGRFGGVTRGRISDSGLGDDRQAKKRWSVSLIGSLFGVGDPVPSSKALGKRSALPTPPVSRPSSSEESGGGHGKRPSLGSRMFSSVSAMSASTQGPYPLPKLIHVLPYGPGHASTPAGPGAARLVRNLEAFLLSWSFGGPKFGEEADDSGAEGAATSSGTGKRTVRPFLLDLAGLNDVLKAQLPDGEVEWPLADLILSGALDDEYPCTGGSPTETPSVPTPDVVVTRASSDARSPTGSGFPNARTPSGSKPKYGNDGLTLDSTPGPMEESWAARRAWLSGVGDLSIYPMPEGLGLVASPTGSNPSSRPNSTASERSRTRSLGGAPPSRPRVSIGGVTASSSSPASSPQLQTPPPSFPTKSFAPTSPASTKPPPSPSTSKPPQSPSGKTPHSRARILSHGRSQSSSAPPVPPLPPSPQETFSSPPPPSTFNNNGRSNFPSESPRYTRNPVPRPPQQSSLDSEDRPRYYSVSDHGHGSPSRNPPPPSTYTDLRRGKSGSAHSGASPLSATPIAAAFARSREQDEFGVAPPTSWNAGTWGTSSSTSSYHVPSPSASLPSRSSMKNSDYISSPAPLTPSRGKTVPQRGGSWDSDSSTVASPRPSVLRKKSLSDRDRGYGSDTPPPPHPSFSSSPKYPGARRRPSEDSQPYFNGYEIAPPPLPTPPPPRPTRAAPPGVSDARNRSTSSPLRHGVSAEGLSSNRPRPGMGGSMMDKRLPITPPDSASSSEVSNDMDMGGRTSDREDKRKWWATPTRPSARLI